MKIKSSIKLPAVFYSKKLFEVFLALLVIVLIACLSFVISWALIGSVTSFCSWESNFLFWEWSTRERILLLFLTIGEAAIYLYYIINKE